MGKKLLSVIFLFILTAVPAAAKESLQALSGNALVPGDYAAYENMGESVSVLPTGAEYSWLPDSDAELISTDTENNGQEMTGGEIKNHSGKYAANSAWGKNTPSTAVFDLKDVYYVDRVDVWSSSTKNQQLGKITVSVSEDGINFTDVGEWQAEVPPAEEIEQNEFGQANSLTVCKFRGFNARYVKVTGEKAERSALGSVCYQYVLGEILIMGKTRKIAEPELLELGFFDENRDRIYSLDKNGEYTARAEALNTDAALIAAYYSGGRLRKLSFAKGEYESPGKSLELECSIEIESRKSGDEIKAFVFDSLENMNPLGKCEAVSETDTGRTGLLSSDSPRSSDMTVYPVCKGYSLVTEGSRKSAEEFRDREYELFDGNITSAVAANSENEAYLNVQIHLKGIMQIERVSVYALCSSESYMSEYEIYASIDGVNYEYAASKTNNISESVGRIMPVSVDIDGVLYASDIRIVMKKSDGAPAMAVAEAEVYGRPPVFGRERLTKYSYEEEVPFKTSADFVSEDSLRTALGDGDIQASVTGSGDYVSVIYEADDFCQIEEARVYGNHAGMELLTSPDGVNYFTAGFYPCVDGLTSACGKAENNARFVKLVFRKGDLFQIELSEIILYARRLYDENEEETSEPEGVFVRASIKPNNILYLDWSDYNHYKNRTDAYKVYIEESPFVSTAGKTLKQVYVGGNKTPVSIVGDKFCMYAGLEPDRDYYVAVAPMTGDFSAVSVTPVKIHTYSALGAEKLSGIFCINEYPYGGGAHVARTPENSPTTEQENLRIKLKLINDMEILSKTRYWENSENIFNTYLSRGLGFHQYVRSEEEVRLCNSFGIYSFCSSNEPDLNAEYQNNPKAYTNVTMNNFQIKNKVNPKNILAEASICGTDRLSFLESLYQAEPDYGNYYDAADVHAYCKAFEGKGNYDDNLSQTSEAYSIPEHLFAKTEKIRNLLLKYNDADKDIIFTETGWSTHTLPYFQEVVAESVTKERQADFVARCYLVSALLGIKNVFLYSFQDESFETTDKEYQFGIVDWYGNPKPAYYTYYTLGKLLKEAEFAGRPEGLEHPDYGAVFYDEEKNMYLTALWNVSGEEKKFTVSSAEDRLLTIGAYGDSGYAASGSQVSVGSSPVYIYSEDILDISE